MDGNGTKASLLVINVFAGPFTLRFCSGAYPECRISSELQQTADCSGTEVSSSDVQGSAEVKITAGGVHF